MLKLYQVFDLVARREAYSWKVSFAIIVLLGWKMGPSIVIPVVVEETTIWSIFFFIDSVILFWLFDLDLSWLIKDDKAAGLSTAEISNVLLARYLVKLIST